MCLHYSDFCGVNLELFWLIYNYDGYFHYYYSNLCFGSPKID